jgi:hypothetical protein
VVRDPREQNFERATVNPVALHDETGKRMIYQLGE